MYLALNALRQTLLILLPLLLIECVHASFWSYVDRNGTSKWGQSDPSHQRVMSYRQRRNPVNTVNIVRANVAVMFVNESKERFDALRMMPAIEMAFERCRTDYNVELNPIETFYSYEKCSPMSALGRLTDLYFDPSVNITATIGPSCSDDVSIVEHFATYHGFPVITGLGDSFHRNQSQFGNSSVIRLSYVIKDKARAILKFLKRFNWRKFGVLYREKSSNYYGSLYESMKSLVKEEEMKIRCPTGFLREETYNKTFVHETVKRYRDCARIIVILSGEKEVQKFLQEAKRLEMTQSGEYVFLYPELFQDDSTGTAPWQTKKATKEDLDDYKQAFQALLIVSLHQPMSTNYLTFKENVKKRFNKNLLAHSLSIETKPDANSSANYFTASFHDGVLLLCQTLQKHPNDTKDTQSLLKHLKNSSLPHGASGEPVTVRDGDRVADFALIDMTDEDAGNFEVILEYNGNTQEFTEVGNKTIVWGGGRTEPPPDEPECGFNGSKCIPSDLKLMETLIIACTVIGVILIICAFLIYRKLRLEMAIANTSWRIRWEDLQFTYDHRSSWMISRLSISSAVSNKMERGWVHWAPGRRAQNMHLEAAVPIKPGQRVLTAEYQGTAVAVKRTPHQKKIELTRDILIELKQIREVQHENLARFVGACIDPPNVAVITEMCPKGSLKDVLQNDSLKLDWLFRHSLINDIVKGMCYLHNSAIGSHGRLRSTNCLVDSRFVLKITDFGLPTFRQHEIYEENIREEQKINLLWKAPELLLEKKPSPLTITGTPKADVYSFSIIVQEIITREEPFYPYRDTLTIEEIIEKVVATQHGGPMFRPRVVQDEEGCSPQLIDLMERCWAHEPELRPTFQQVKVLLRQINKSVHGGEMNIMEDIMCRMEQYATELESLVEERTAAFLEEKRRSEELLYQVLPKSVAEQLKRGKQVIPELYDSVTIYFSDIVGFTSMSSESTPIQVVDFLNDLYTCFDSVISDFHVYKVETIGDAYMVVSGLPDRNGIQHAFEIASMAIRLRSAVAHFTIRHRPDEQLKLRIGIHTGPCCAGVVGQKMPRYCLFGDTVNTASRMESSGEALRIHVSPDTKVLLDRFGTFDLQPRGAIDIKGKGVMHTYWLQGMQQTATV